MKRHPYILATLIATLTAIVVWFIVPKKYTAYTKLSDEYKEVELSIGLNVIQAHVKNLMGSANEGINDMEVYSKVIKTEDFARCIADKQVASKGITYGAYLDCNDTIEAIQDAIIYNYLRSQETLSIAFTDKDPVVASQMLDSVTTELQRIITRHRRTIIAAALKNANREVSETKAKYDKAVHDYSRFAEGHTKVKTPTMKLQEQALESEVKSAQSIYRKAREKQIRQQALSQRYQMAFTVIQDNTVPATADNPLWVYILCFVVLTLVITHIGCQYRRMGQKSIRLSELGDLSSPWMLTITIWTLILGFYYLLDTDLYPIKSQFYICLTIWVPVFCLCALGAYMLSSHVDDCQPAANGIDFNKAVFNFFFIVSLIITPLYVYRVIQIVTMFGTEDLMTNIRTLALYGEGQGILNYSAVINQALFVVALWAYPRVPLWQVVVLGIACMMNSLAIMEKGSMFFVFVSTMFVHSHRQRHDHRRVLHLQPGARRIRQHLSARRVAIRLHHHVCAVTSCGFQSVAVGSHSPVRHEHVRDGFPLLETLRSRRCRQEKGTRVCLCTRLHECVHHFSALLYRLRLSGHRPILSALRLRLRTALPSFPQQPWCRHLPLYVCRICIVTAVLSGKCFPKHGLRVAVYILRCHLCKPFHQILSIPITPC